MARQGLRRECVSQSPLLRLLLVGGGRVAGGSGSGNVAAVAVVAVGNVGNALALRVAAGLALVDVIGATEEEKQKNQSSSNKWFVYITISCGVAADARAEAGAHATKPLAFLVCGCVGVWSCFSVPKKAPALKGKNTEERKKKNQKKSTYLKTLPRQEACCLRQLLLISTVSQTGHQGWYWIRELPVSTSRGARATRALAAPARATMNAVVCKVKVALVLLGTIGCLYIYLKYICQVQDY